MLVLFGTLLFALDVQSAYAQSSQCANLQGALRQFDSNADFQRSGSNSRQARQLAAQVQDAESQYIRGGCNDDAKAGRQLTRQCQQIGRDVLRLRREYADVSQSVETANAVAGQREAILQEMARFGCNSGSSAGFSQDRQSVFDRVFGSTTEGDFTNGQMIDGGDYWNSQGYNTVRTVCVRLSDGYFWPISYSTLQEYIANDAQTCQQSCPNTSVDLYFYNNPGEEPEQMRNMYGQPYTSLPTAFAYRNKFDQSASCTVRPTADGTITRASTATGTGRAMVELNGVRFPLPMRDPRGVAPVQAPVAAAPVSTVAMADVPLPRPRPGSTAATQATTQEAANDKLRLIQLGDRTVRVVGPDTPYAQAGRAGS
jgi:hypothetical protein